MLLINRSKYKIIAIVGLPCSGKSTISTLLLQNAITQTKIRCYTSRNIRQSDKQLDEYTFIERTDFEKNIEEFYDLSEIHEDYYGTKTIDIIQAISSPQLSSIICNIEVSLKLFYMYSNLIKLIFIDCPLSLIYERAKQRDKESERTIIRINNCLDWSDKIELLIAKGKIPFIRINNSGNVMQTLDEIILSLNN